MIVRMTIVESLEHPRTGGTNVKLALLMVEGLTVIGSPRWHRTFIPGDMEASVQMNEVADGLELMGEAQLSAEELDKIYRFHEFVRGI